MKKAFTMIELVFVIVVIGILSAIAIPKFAATRDDALISRGKSTLSSVRNAIATERQKRVLRGDFNAITDLSSTDSGSKIFTTFSADKKGKKNPVLEYPLKNGTTPGYWSKANEIYTFHYYDSGKCDFNLSSNKLSGDCSVFGD